MPIFHRRSLCAGLILGLVQAAPASADDPPLPSPRSAPSSPGGPGDAFASFPPEPLVARPVNTVIEVPPEGIQPTGGRDPLDPVATERRGPSFIAKKIRSWHWRRLQGKMLGYPEKFTPRPLGSALHDHGRTMVSNGAEARLTLFEYDFEPNSAQLSTRGRDQLAKMAAQLAASPFPLIIERTPRNPELAVARREAVLGELVAASFPIDGERVLVGVPLPFGMSGVNAQIVGANALNRVQQYGPPIPINANGVNSPSGVTNQMSGVLPGQ